MKQVIMIPSLTEAKEEKPVEFTHITHPKEGWRLTSHKPTDDDVINVFYIGKCVVDGDMFAVTSNDRMIRIYKGHLNSGKY